jgi:sugar phosphate isomerase/epimerase
VDQPPAGFRYDETQDLTLSVMTLRKAGFEVRARAAAGAGFAGIGWRWEDFAEGGTEAVEAGVGLLSELQLEATELEFLRDWLGRDNNAEYQEEEKRLWAAANRLGTTRVSVADFDPQEPELLLPGFKGLCRRAAEYGLTVQLEFMPYTPPVDSLGVAWELLQKVDEPNTGLLIDAWHWARSRNPGADLQRIPPERITGIQLGDAPKQAAADLEDESRHHRLVPGGGEFDLVGWLRQLAAHGVRAPLAVEVMSDELDDLSPETAAQLVADGTREVLKAAGQTGGDGSRS